MKLWDRQRPKTGNFSPPIDHLCRWILHTHQTTTTTTTTTTTVSSMTVIIILYIFQPSPTELLFPSRSAFQLGTGGARKQSSNWDQSLLNHTHPKYQSDRCTCLIHADSRVSNNKCHRKLIGNWDCYSIVSGKGQAQEFSCSKVGFSFLVWLVFLFQTHKRLFGGCLSVAV